MTLSIHKFGRILGAAAALAVLAQPAFASSHREAPAIANDPAADNTDLWAWVKSGSHDRLYVVAAWNPLEEPAGGPNFHKFSDDVLYEVHIARGASLKDAVTYQFRFKTTPTPHVDPADLKAPLGGGKEFFAQLSGQTQTMDVYRIDAGDDDAKLIARDVPVAPINYGPRTQTVLSSLGALSSPTYDDAFAATFLKPTSEGGQVWAGPRDDGFYVDLGGIFDLANLRAKGVAQDGVAGFNCHAIALEIPTTALTGNGKAPGNKPGNDTTLGVWTSSSRRQVTVLHHNGTTSTLGPWVQVSRLGLPLINEAVIGIQDKDRYNRTRPYTDVANFGAYFLNPVIVRDAEAVGIYKALGVDPTPFKSNRLDIIDTINLTNIPSKGAHSFDLAATGDVLRVDMAVDSGFPNGRPIPGARPNQEQADVTDVLLSVLLSKGLVNVSDGVDYNDVNYLADMPFLPLPHRGWDGGHGKPTP